jgi:hypothetical protein
MVAIAQFLRFACGLAFLRCIAAGAGRCFLAYSPKRTPKKFRPGLFSAAVQAGQSAWISLQ